MWYDVRMLLMYEDKIDDQVVERAYIVSTPGVRGGKPRIDGHRITVADVATWYLKMDYPLEQIADEYQLSLASVYAAMAYYFEHRVAIDAQTEESERFAENMRQQTPSILQKKLNALRNDRANSISF